MASWLGCYLGCGGCHRSPSMSVSQHESSVIDTSTEASLLFTVSVNTDHGLTDSNWCQQVPQFWHGTQVSAQSQQQYHKSSYRSQSQHGPFRSTWPQAAAQETHIFKVPGASRPKDINTNSTVNTCDRISMVSGDRTDHRQLQYGPLQRNRSWTPSQPLAVTQATKLRGPQTTSWFQVAAQTVSIHMAFSSNTGHQHQLSSWLQ